MLPTVSAQKPVVAGASLPSGAAIEPPLLATLLEDMNGLDCCNAKTIGGGL
jgi:hypothetical protein